MKRRLLFIYLQPSSFVREDLRILSEEYDIRPFHFGWDAKPGPLEFGAMLLRQLTWLLRELPRSDIVFGWFSDYHMVLPVLMAQAFRKPVAVSIGGFDAVSMPSLRHGIGASGWRMPLARLVLRLADLLLPVSSSLIYSKNRFAERVEEEEQGLRRLLPDLATRIEVVPTGYDPDEWPIGPLERDPIVSTVAYLDGDRVLRIKGIDLVIETARRMPEVSFNIIGVIDPESVRERFDPPSNVRLVAPVERAKLVDHYHSASVYLQLSRMEGLPNALCEAMLCGCIPVGSRVFGIPDGIGDAGYVVERPDPDEVVSAVRRALEAPGEMRLRAREHIIAHFSLERRSERLLGLLDELVRGGDLVHDGRVHAD